METAALSSLSRQRLSNVSRAGRCVSRDSGEGSQAPPAGLNDSMRAGAVAPQAKQLLKAAVETGLAKQNRIQMQEAGLFSLPHKGLTAANLPGSSGAT